jgi:hypothetical protein
MNSNTFIKYVFQFFEPFRARLLQNLAKSAVSQYAEFYANFKSIEKVAKKITLRKLEG